MKNPLPFLLILFTLCGNSNGSAVFFRKRLDQTQNLSSEKTWKKSENVSTKPALLLSEITIVHPAWLEEQSELDQMTKSPPANSKTPLSSEFDDITEDKSENGTFMKLKIAAQPNEKESSEPEGLDVNPNLDDEENFILEPESLWMTRLSRNTRSAKKGKKFSRIQTRKRPPKINHWTKYYAIYGTSSEPAPPPPRPTSNVTRSTQVSPDERNTTVTTKE